MTDDSLLIPDARSTCCNDVVFKDNTGKGAPTCAACKKYLSDEEVRMVENMADPNFNGHDYRELYEHWDLDDPDRDVYYRENVAEAVALHLKRSVTGTTMEGVPEEEVQHMLGVAEDLQAYLHALADREVDIGFTTPFWRGLANMYRPDAESEYDQQASAAMMLKYAAENVERMWS